MLESFAASVGRYRASLADTSVRLCPTRLDALCEAAGVLAPPPAAPPTTAGGWAEFVQALLFSAINYRFVHLRTLERPRLAQPGRPLGGSLAVEQDLRRLVDGYGGGRTGLRRLAGSLQPGHWSPGVARGLCDLDARCARLRRLAAGIDADWVAWTAAHEQGDIDAGLRMAAATGLYEDPFHKRIQHLAYRWMHGVARMHRHLPRARGLTALCDYRLPELLLDLGVIAWQGAEPPQADGGVLRLPGADPRVAALRSACAQVVDTVAARSDMSPIEVDQWLWQASRSRPRSTCLVIDTDAF